MKCHFDILDEKQQRNYNNLAEALALPIEDLLSFEFHNENIFDAGGEVVMIKYVFSAENPLAILDKIKGLDNNNSVVLSVDQLSYNG